MQSDSTFNNFTMQEDLLKKRLEYFSNILYLYYLPIVVFIGIIGNSLTLIILFMENKLLAYYDVSQTFKANLTKLASRNNTNNKKIDFDTTENATSRTNKRHYSIKSTSRQFSSSNFFIASLAISDLIYNIILALVWLTRIGTNVLNVPYICELSIALSYICSFLSAAFTTLFTFQRFTAVVYPLKSATSFSLHSKSKIKSTILILVLFSICVYSFSLFMYDTSPKKEHEQSTEMKNICGIKQGYVNIVNIIDNTVDSFLTLIIPSMCILFMNIGIIKIISSKQEIFNKIKSIKTKRENSNIEKENVSFIEETKFPRNDIMPIVNLKDEIENTPAIEKCNKNGSHSTNNSHITKSLLAVSFFFILLNSPFRATKLFSFIQMILKKSEVYSNFDFAMNEVLINLYFTSYSVNFFLYSMCGKKFRASLKALMYMLLLFFYKIICFFFTKKNYI